MCASKPSWSRIVEAKQTKTTTTTPAKTKELELAEENATLKRWLAEADVFRTALERTLAASEAKAWRVIGAYADRETHLEASNACLTEELASVRKELRRVTLFPHSELYDASDP
jgi:hypothetical protein